MPLEFRRLIDGCYRVIAHDGFIYGVIQPSTMRFFSTKTVFPLEDLNEIVKFMAEKVNENEEMVHKL